GPGHRFRGPGACSRSCLVSCFGLVAGCVGAGTAAFAGGVEGSGDLPLVQAGLAGGGGQGAEVGGGVGVQGAVGGPEQAGVAGAFGVAGGPPSQVGGGL